MLNFEQNFQKKLTCWHPFNTLKPKYLKVTLGCELAITQILSMGNLTKKPMLRCIMWDSHCGIMWPMWPMNRKQCKKEEKNIVPECRYLRPQKPYFWKKRTGPGGPPGQQRQDITRCKVIGSKMSFSSLFMYRFSRLFWVKFAMRAPQGMAWSAFFSGVKAWLWDKMGVKAWLRE